MPVGLTAKQIVGAYLEDQWEDFIEEWTSSKSCFAKIERVSGSGDQGRDVMCLDREPMVAGHWVNYQCKHLAHPLMPSEAWVELGKLCYFTFIGDFPVPRQYRFVCPHDVGPSLHYYLNHPVELRDELIREWSDKCEKKITAKLAVPLEGDLLKYVQAFDFSIVNFTPLVEVLAEHRTTHFWAERFKAALPKRPDPLIPPAAITAGEAGYVAKLLEAYGDVEKRQFASVAELAAFENYNAHLKRARKAFFRADQLNRFSREISTPGAFEKFKEQVMDGVADTLAETHAHGLARVTATTKAAATLQLGNCELAPLVEVADRHGACHHLANDGQIKSWITS